MDQKTVLLADDDDFAQTVISAMFKGLNVNIVVAADGKQALETYQQRNGAGLSYILMDLHMPIMDGYESTRQIRSYEKAKGLKAAKIIGLSADNDAKTVAECKASGMNDHIQKPVKKDVLQSHL